MTAESEVPPFASQQPTGRQLPADIVEKVGKLSGSKISHLCGTGGRGRWMASQADDAGR